MFKLLSFAAKRAPAGLLKKQLALAQTRCFSFAQPLHSHSVSLQQQVDLFFLQQSNSDEFKIPKLTDFINTALLSRTITFEEHRDFRPLVDELVFYVHRWYYDCEQSGKPQVVGLDDVLTLLKFAESFEV